MKLLRPLFSILGVTASIGLLGSCNTVAGLGKDLKKAGQAVTTPDAPATTPSSAPAYDPYTDQSGGY